MAPLTLNEFKMKIVSKQELIDIADHNEDNICIEDILLDIRYIRANGNFVINYHEGNIESTTVDFHYLMEHFK